MLQNKFELEDKSDNLKFNQWAFKWTVIFIITRLSQQLNEAFDKWALEKIDW